MAAPTTWGDHVGHTAALAELNHGALAAMVPFHPTGAQIAAGFGAADPGRGLPALGGGARGAGDMAGCPTGFIDSPLDPDELAAIRAIYRDQGAGFLATPEGWPLPAHCVLRHLGPPE